MHRGVLETLDHTEPGHLNRYSSAFHSSGEYTCTRCNMLEPAPNLMIRNRTRLGSA